MPVFVSLDGAERALYVLFSGVVGEKDLTDSYRMIRTVTDPTYGPTANVIVDVTRVEHVDAAAERLLIAAVRCAHATGSFPVPARAAIVAPRDALFGLARMYQSYRESQGCLTRYLVCRTMTEARHWLGLPWIPAELRGTAS